MIKEAYKIRLITIALLLYAVVFSGGTVLAGVLDGNTAADTINSFTKDTGPSAGYSNLGTEGIGTIVALVIKALLGLLGVIFIYLMVLAGYNWMTAAGDEQKVEKAKDEIKRAIIGLIIIVSAYAITYFVLEAMSSVASPTGGQGYGTY